MLTLKDLEKRKNLYFFPGNENGFSKEEARNILYYNNWMEYKIPISQVTSEVFARIIQEIEILKTKG